VVVQAVVGYGASKNLIPAPIRSAILLLIGDLYENRENRVIGQGFTPVNTGAAEALLWPYRCVTF